MGKKGNANGQSTNTTNELIAKCRAEPDLAASLELMEKLPCQELSASQLAAVLSLLATKAASAGKDLAASGLELGEKMLAASAATNSGRPLEPAVTVMVRLCCSAGRPQRALALVEEARRAGMKPKLRNLLPVLVQAADAQDTVACEAVWAEIPKWGLVPQDTEYAAMLRGHTGKRQRQKEILLQMLEDLPLPSDPPLVQEIGNVFGVDKVLDFKGTSPQMREGREEGDGSGRRWHVGWSSIDPLGVCSLSGYTLQGLRISRAEEEELFSSTSKLANDSGCNKGFRLYQKWLLQQEPFDVIIDGANVGFNNQNHEGGHFQYPQIDIVVQHFLSLSQRVLLVLHPKWLKEDANLSIVRRKRRKFDPVSKSKDTDADPMQGIEEEDDDADIVYPHDGITDSERTAAAGTPLALIREWKELGVLVCVPFQDCDDWYWLYAALDSFRRGNEHVQVISNDHMRDHHWRMDSQKAFVQWQDRHMTRICIQAEEDKPDELAMQLYPPRPFSLRSQLSKDGQAWHFPIPAVRSRAEQLSSGRPVAAKELETAEHRWLVAYLAAPGARPTCGEGQHQSLQQENVLGQQQRQEEAGQQQPQQQQQQQQQQQEQAHYQQEQQQPSSSSQGCAQAQPSAGESRPAQPPPQREPHPPPPPQPHPAQPQPELRPEPHPAPQQPAQQPAQPLVA
eukprot:CAMPEP_0206618934 /NCGR_PEP_ID=MMETSP0325_2-20121206/60552_1 /ASSEMBLY_ACC=CAM_ASM_000347 /TAXON_ID=2866 /ORGANISM="Crypthecodinium cohnii, Strain Seligo" /LENGTH=678 /DNA_ID=CAMNT_0054141255 /DNA_START=253 /DNA_END=2289 /DNA_ORIENTATION=+